jgi:RNA polymerase sigma factor (sigma-70 family)
VNRQSEYNFTVPDDHAILKQFAKQFAATGKSDAFSELLRRYEPLVYAAARRQVVDPHLAQDITQATMMVLMRKAGKIRRKQPLGPWLLRVAHYLAIDALRGESSRRRHERSAAQQRREFCETPISSPWPSIEPILDQALHALNNRDRTILVLRYLQGCTIDQIAGELSLTQQATRQRLSRALRRLRNELSRRGISKDDLAPTLLLRFKIKTAMSDVWKLLRPQAIVTTAVIIVTLAGGLVLTRAATRRSPINSSAGMTTNLQTAGPSALANSRPKSTIP